MKSKLRKISCLGLTAVMLSTFIAGNALAFANNSGKATEATAKYDTVDFEKVTGKVDLTGIAIQNMNNTVLDADDKNTGIKISGNETYTVIATLKEDAVIDVKPESQSVSDYLTTFSGDRTLEAIQRSQKNFLNELKKAGIKYEYVSSFNTVTNSVAIKVKGSLVSKVKKLASVESLVFSSTYARPEEADVSVEKATAVTNPNDVYATGIYDSSEYVKKGLDGSGVTIAILDTGLDYTHDAFNVMPEEVAFTEEYVASKMATGNLIAQQFSARNGTTITAEDVYINAKVPFAYDYSDKDADVYPAYSQHGTHVAGISAGDSDKGYDDKNGNYVEELFQGSAPKAQLVICKVFTDDFDSQDLGGAVTEDILAALDDCVSLGVDVINMSLGTSAGFSSVAIDGDTEGEWLNKIYTKIKDEGISLICAASNDYSSGYGSAFGTNLATNPDSGTVGSPSTFDGAMSVASINGQKARYFTVDASANSNYSAAEPVFYTESSDANYQKNDFLYGLIGGDKEGTYKEGEYKFKYVVINGAGQASDYSSAILNHLNVKSNEYPNGLKQQGEKVIAVIKRGSNTFQQKVEIAMRMGADAVIIYNNVAGGINMNLGDIDDPVPAISVTMDAGAVLTSIPRTGSVQVGSITVNETYQAGPFMNDYSSWGATPDLKLKPDITSYGGEITSTVSGGYAEMSGTSMATPNLAGFTALLRSYLKGKGLEGTELTERINNLMMSTATTVYNEEGLPYSPRKQGAGLATLENVFGTKAYLNTDKDVTEDGRPKIELGDGLRKEYNLKFYVNNFDSATDLTFYAKSVFMTETLSSDKLSVAEKAHILDDEKAVWKIGGKAAADGEEFTVAAGQTVSVEVTLKLSDAEIKYINDSFKNGMYVEGFITLVSKTEGQCNLNLPFMGFYGDWKSAPMLDYDCYEISEFEQDSSYTDETRPQAQVWATQAYASYYDNKYVIPMGNYVYLQDENAEQVYTNIEYSAISRFNEIVSDEGTGNKATTYRIKALYAGLLRNAELVTYDMYNTDTGELIVSDCVYRVNKAYAGGGSATPAQVLLELEPDKLGLIENGRYSMEFHFYMDAENTEDNDENTFNMIFYVDYEAPVLESSSIRYYDYKEDNIKKQRVYLDLEVYDNHYAQAVMLCYPQDGNNNGQLDEIVLATKYITPVLNPTKGGTSKVTIEITDLISTEQNFYLQIMDYALNYNVYALSISSAQETVLPDSFTVAEDDNVKLVNGEYTLTIGVNETYTINLEYAGNANLSNFEWYSSRPDLVAVQNGEVFGVSTGTSTITVTGKNGVNRKVRVNVVASNTTLKSPKISFGTIKNADEGLVKAQGTVEVNAGSEFKMPVIFEPWYYPTEGLIYRWSSSNERYVTVDENGNVSVANEKGSASIICEIYNKNNSLMSSTRVVLSVRDPFTVTGSTLTAYHGSGGDIVLPTDKNIMTIAEDVFKDNDNITSIVIPSTVTTINARAFARCTALKSVTIAGKLNSATGKSSLATVMKNAFADCKALETVDFTNCKTVTLDRGAFSGCTSLKEVKGMEKIGTMNGGAFSGCTSLKEVNLTGLHMSGNGVFKGCTSLASIITDFYTAIGYEMFKGCTSLTSVTINTPTVGENAFENCTSLASVTFGSQNSNLVFSIGAYAFNNCTQLSNVQFNGNAVSKIGDMAFGNCAKLSAFDLQFTKDMSIGDQVFKGTAVTFNDAVYDGTTLVIAPTVITSGFAIKSDTTEIASYAFSSSTLASGVTSINIPASVTRIGEGAFAYLGITSVTIPSGLTEIADYAFYAAQNLTSVTIPANITRIGVSAFEGCTALTQITFASGSQLETIGSFAFMNCTEIESVTLPDGCADMGDRVFSGCLNLTTVTLPSVTNLGLQTFAHCENLERVTFGTDASTTGEETFAGCEKLAAVVLGDRTKSVGYGVFNGCKALESINLKNVTSIEGYAFTLCNQLATVTGLENVEYIGRQAFAGCESLGTANLASALVIEEEAFYDGKLTSLTLSAVNKIGAFAFYGSSFREVSLPESLEYLGDGAFAHSENLRTINVNERNKTYFSVDGVVYRNVTNAKTNETFYELSAYPTYKSGASYEIKEGTIQIQGYAFAYMRGLGFLKQVTLPYSVKAIGASAFYDSGVLTYNFECVEAPVLYSEYYDNGVNTLHNSNFEDELVLHVELEGFDIEYDGTPQTLTISYPSNGTGYDNLVYSNYFKNKTIAAEIMDNTTRALKASIEGFKTAAEVTAWNSLAVNAENKAMVEAFANEVKAAHAMYNTITSEVQLGFLGSDNVDKLFAIESALKPVKTKFGISATVSALALNANSAHKSEYKVGETFDMTGLLIDVTYDDYYSETIGVDSGRFTLSTTTPLTVYSKAVIIYVDGRMIQVAVNVTEEGGGDKPEPPEPPKPSTLNPAVIYGPIIGVVVLAGAAVAVVLVLRKKKTNISEDKKVGDADENKED